MKIHFPIALAALLVIGCETETDFEPPDTPDITATLAQYEAPSAELTPQTGRQLVEGVLRSLENIERMGRLLGYITQLIPEFSEAASGGSESNGLRIQQRKSALTTTVVLHGLLDHQCDRQTGALQINAVLVQSEIQPDIWGDLNGCLIANDTAPDDTFDGTVQLRLAGLAGVTRTTFIFEGTVTRQGVSESLDFDLQILPDERFLVTEAVEGGHLVAVLKGVTQGLELEIRDRNGTWHCGLVQDGSTECWDSAGANVSW